MSQVNKINRIIQEATIWIALVAVIIFFSLMSKEFLTLANIMNVLNQTVTMGIMAAGVVFVQIAGGVDLTCGAQISVCGVVAAMMMVRGVHPILASAAAVAVCMLIGVINGLLVTKAKIIAIIATLGMSQIIQGFSYTLSNGVGIYGLPSGFAVLGQGRIGIVPISVIIYVVIIAVVSFVLNNCFFGRYFYAVGGGAEVARLSGIDPNRVRFASYVISGFFCGIAGIITLSRLQSALSSTGLTMNMDVMTGVVLGGISAMVARNTVGKYSGVVAGCLLMTIINNGLVMMGATEYARLIVKGIILLLALSMDNFDLAKIVAVFQKNKENA